MFFNHFVDKEKYKERWNFDYKLKKLTMINYLSIYNLKKFKQNFTSGLIK